jgi:hypothetical protein
MRVRLRGGLYGESPANALAVYLVNRYAVRPLRAGGIQRVYDDIVSGIGFART